jgi:putative transposase
MRKTREFTEGTSYHVTSRTNDKKRVFECNVGRKTMLLVLRDAKEKFGFRLSNFCIMPTHIHLLITPAAGTNLSKIMQWIKTHSAKRWNSIHGSTDHLWGDRFFARPVKDLGDYFFVMDYIDKNPIKAGLALSPAEWKPGGAYYIANNKPGLVDFNSLDRIPYIKLLPKPVTDTFSIQRRNRIKVPLKMVTDTILDHFRIFNTEGTEVVTEITEITSCSFFAMPSAALCALPLWISVVYLRPPNGTWHCKRQTTTETQSTIGSAGVTDTFWVQEVAQAKKGVSHSFWILAMLGHFLELNSPKKVIFMKYPDCKTRPILISWIAKKREPQVPFIH